MANSWFQFKQFIVRQDRCAFKVGTDGVLLGAWADTENVERVLDIGTGTGLLALMLAQRSVARITAIEIDRASYEQAVENFNESPWKDRIKVLNCPVQEFDPEERFDLILCNPPFFHDSVQPADIGRLISRHSVKLSLEELSRAARRLMNDNGKFCLVLPGDESRNFDGICSQAGLFLHRILDVIPTPRHSLKRRLMEFRLYPAGEVNLDKLTIEREGRHDFTDHYRGLTKDFYLDF